MSGIACLFDRTHVALEGEDVASMSTAIAHRGSDNEGRWEDSKVGLAHRQLATTPEDMYDDQPRRLGDCVGVADIRLDNRADLLESLSVNMPPEHVPDADFLLRAYREWGQDCVGRLDGAFAFAIWDLEDQTMFCARDRFGVKPLYYHHSEDLFAVGSEPKAILALKPVSRTVDNISIGDLLMHNFEDQERTFFESIRRLPPATAVTVGADDTDRWEYWQLDPTHTVTLNSDAAYEQRFRELFSDAVKKRLRSTEPIGTDLSGGLDSTAVTVMARNLLPEDQPIHTFSNVFDETPDSDEREFFKTTTDRAGLLPHRIKLDNTGALVDREQVLQYLDHPPHNTMHFAKWERLKTAADAGIGVHLSGEMGDSAVGYGFGMLPHLLRTGQLVQLFDELRDMSDVVGALTYRLFRDNAVDPLIPTDAKRLYRKLRGDAVLAERANPTLKSSFIRAYGLNERYRSYDDNGAIRKRSGRRWQHRSLRSGRITATLETIDMMQAAHGVEPRHPFTDRKLVEFALAIPPTQQLSGGYTRSIIRRALGDLLPDKIQWRPWKTMVGHAAWHALANEDDALQRLIDNPEPVATYLDTDELRQAYNQFCETQSADEARSLWKALALAEWLEARNPT